MSQAALDFSGPEYRPSLDRERLSGQHQRIKALLSDGKWRTLGAIEAATGDPQASISAQIRFLKRPEFGGFVVEKRRSGDRKRGLFEYRVLAPVGGAR